MAEEKEITETPVKRWSFPWVYTKFGFDTDATRFFWVVFVYSHIYLVLIWMEFANVFIARWFDIPYRPDLFRPHPVMMEIYRVSLSGYALVNEMARWTFHDVKIEKPGFYMVGMWILMGGFIGFCASISKSFIVPDQLSEIVTIVITVFFFSGASKLFYEKKTGITTNPAASR